jgi:hypothetical protein
MKTSSLYLATHLKHAIADVAVEFDIPPGNIGPLAEALAGRVINARSLAMYQQKPGPKAAPVPKVPQPAPAGISKGTPKPV